ncbi:MAG: radical SAM protein [Thermodesulfobacteriota bacterium]
MASTLRGFHFNTASGADYYYDDCTGMVYPCPEGLKHFLLSRDSRNVGRLRKDPTNERKPWERFVNERHAAFGAFLAQKRRKRTPPRVTPSDIINSIDRQGFRQLILTLTSNCNMQCRYCVNSDQYPYASNFPHGPMSFRVAQKAIDYYLGNLTKMRRSDPCRKGAITFYGGEPLLQFSVLVRSVQFIRERGTKDILFNVSTNGLLLDDHISDFLVENHFGIWVSLDGPRKEHDRNRLLSDGRGTFGRVFANVERFWKRHPGYRLLGFLVTYDWGTDMFELLKFFDGREEFRRSMFMFNQVSPYFTDYYRRFSAQDRKRFLEKAKELKGLLYSHSKEASPLINFFVSATNRIHLMRKIMGPPGRPEIPATGACLPGEKICVLPDGRFQPCERVPGFAEIGTVEKGLDFEAIADVVNQYNQVITRHCHSCPILMLCKCCFSHFWSGKEITKPSPSFCRDHVAWIREILVETYSLLEEVPEFYDHVMNLYQRDYRHWEFLSTNC